MVGSEGGETMRRAVGGVRITRDCRGVGRKEGPGSAGRCKGLGLF